MASKYQAKNNSFYYENSDTPKNKYNIKDSEIIHQIEKDLIEEAYKIFFVELDEDTIFNEEYYIKLHKKTFENLYDWAGNYRDFNMSKGESRFCQGAFIISSSKKIFDELKKDNYLKDYQNKSKEDFAKKLAYYKCELNVLHPFYELNGRITRMFFDMIVSYNEYEPIDYSTIKKDEYIQGAIECVIYADASKFENFILKGLIKIK